MDSDPSGARPPYWEGLADLFDGREAKARETPVAIGPDGMEIRGGEAAGWYRRRDIALIDHGSEGAYFSLELKPHDGMVLAFRNKEAMEWLRSAGLLKGAAFAGMSWVHKVGILIVILAAFSAFMYLVGLDLASNAIVRVLPRKIDRTLGSWAVQTFSDSSSKAPDTLARRALAKSEDLVRRLGPPDADSIHIRVMPDTVIKNAFAFPGGHIVVTRGMLRMLESQEEWLALMAHEGGHIHLRHGMRQIVRSSILAVAASLVFGDVSGVGSTLLDNAGTLANLSYSRRDEGEADEFALSRLEKAGQPATGLSTLFEKLLALQELPAWAAFFSTHPATEERIARFKNLPKGTKANLLTAEEWAALKGM